MKTITTTAIVALMTATIGLSAIAPAIAQDARPAAGQAQMQKGNGGNFRNHEQGGPRMGGPRMGGDFLSVEGGTEAMEIAFVRLSHAIELTAEQQPLFDAFKTSAIAAAGDFATATEALRPAAPVEGQTRTAPDFSDRIENRIALETAHLAALEAIQADATAFFESLTDEQKAALTPQRPERDGKRDGMPGFGPGGPRHEGGQHGGPAAGGPVAPPAPDAAPADAPAAPADAPAEAPAVVNG